MFAMWTGENVVIAEFGKGEIFGEMSMDRRAAFGDGDRHRGYRFMCLTGLMVLSGIGTAFGPPPRR